MANFRMNQIKVEQFAIIENQLPNDVQLETELTYGAEKDHIVLMRLTMSYKNGTDLLAKMVLVCTFGVAPESWTEWEREGKVIIPRLFLAHLAMHTFGTARGVLFAKTEGTPYQQMILPPTNVENMIKEDLVVE